MLLPVIVLFKETLLTILLIFYFFAGCASIQTSIVAEAEWESESYGVDSGQDYHGEGAGQLVDLGAKEGEDAADEGGDGDCGGSAGRREDIIVT